MSALLIDEINVVFHNYFINFIVNFDKRMCFKSMLQTVVIEEERIPQERSPD